MSDDTPAEPSMRHRRVFTFLFSLLNAIGIAIIIFKLDEPSDLRWIGLALIASNLALAGFYMAGASMIDWALVTKAWRKGDKDAG